MNKKIVLLFIILCFFTGGCTLAPKYTQPKAPVAAEWPKGEAYKNADGSQTAPNGFELKWEDFFVDTNLRQIITLAIENNRDLLIAALNVERARALYGIKKADLYPAIGATASASKARVPADLSYTGSKYISEEYGVGLGIASWELDFAGRIRSLKSQALQEYMATEQARRSVQISLVSEVANVYMTYAADRERLKLAKSTLSSQESAYSLIEKRFNAGLATDLALKQAQIPVETARGDVARYKQKLAEDKNALNLLVGSQLSVDLLPVSLNSISPLKAISPGLSSETLLQRPDIIQAEHRLKGAYAYIGAARAALFPRVSLTSAFGTASSDLSGLFKSGSGTWSFAPQISLPIFDARTWAALRVSKSERKIVLAQYEKTIQTAFREVADALAVQGTIDERVAAKKSLVGAVEETYSLSTKRYQMGIDSYLGVLDAQRTLYVQQQGLILLNLAKLSSQVRLYAVLGGGAR